MYPLDMVSSLTGLSEKQIYRLEKDGVINPRHQSGMKYYSFLDIYVLKITAIARRSGIQFKNIGYAYDCLKELKPEKKLSSFTLFHDGNEILDFTDDIKIIASKYGQIVDQGLLPHVQPLALGSELELTRQKFEDFSSNLKKRKAAIKKSGKPVSSEEIHSLLYG